MRPRNQPVLAPSKRLTLMSISAWSTLEWAALSTFPSTRTPILFTWSRCVVASFHWHCYPLVNLWRAINLLILWKQILPTRCHWILFNFVVLLLSYSLFFSIWQTLKELLRYFHRILRTSRVKIYLFHQQLKPKLWKVIKWRLNTWIGGPGWGSAAHHCQWSG